MIGNPKNQPYVRIRDEWHKIGEDQWTVCHKFKIYHWHSQYATRPREVCEECRA